LEQNPEEVKHWLEVEYPEIRKQAKKEKAQIFWGDEMGMRSDHPPSQTSDATPGGTKILPGKTCPVRRRFKCIKIYSLSSIWRQLIGAVTMCSSKSWSAIPSAKENFYKNLG
jgi:hypothetical protein